MSQSLPEKRTSASDTDKVLPPPPLNSIPSVAKLYLTSVSALVSSEEYRRVLQQFAEIRSLITSGGPVSGRLASGCTVQSTIIEDDQAQEKALWVIAYVCGRFGGSNLLRRDKRFYSECGSQSRASAMADILQKIAMPSERVRILSNVRDIWIALRLLIFKATSQSPLSDSLPEIEWYFNYVLTIGPIETLRHIKSLRKGRKLGFDTYVGLKQAIKTQGDRLGEKTCSSFRYFMSSDILCLTGNYSYKVIYR